MATATFVHDGRSIDYTPSADVAAGDVVVQGDLVGIAKLDIAANTLGALATVGVFDVAKATGASTAITAGAIVYWDATNSVATTDDASGANKRLGKTVAAAGDDDATVRVQLGV
jgi:predicted RecA/RadA family phage recombinase